ncbi:MAG: hypothetical protein A3H29_08700 [Acidobacteria bacterium RIFCSPLOWO2_02_FULL_67_21]|nr:MAG: hypothetical protein A3H29_08700 [Acidobacteria bacterium RIFCSPLOWO2_02_FULL_67_21]
MSRKRPRHPLEAAPAPHAPSRHVPRAPKERPAAAPPNPRRPKLVSSRRAVLNDLFALFPDLPSPPRRPASGVAKLRRQAIRRRP